MLLHFFCGTSPFQIFLGRGSEQRPRRSLSGCRVSHAGGAAAGGAPAWRAGGGRSTIANHHCCNPLQLGVSEMLGSLGHTASCGSLWAGSKRQPNSFRPAKYAAFRVQASGSSSPEEGAPKAKRRGRRAKQQAEPKTFKIEELNPVTSKGHDGCRSLWSAERRRCRWRRCKGGAAAPGLRQRGGADRPPLCCCHSSSAVGRKSREVFDDVWSQLQRIGNPARSSSSQLVVDELT